MADGLGGVRDQAQVAARLDFEAGPQRQSAIDCVGELAIDGRPHPLGHGGAGAPGLVEGDRLGNLDDEAGRAHVVQAAALLRRALGHDHHHGQAELFERGLDGGIQIALLLQERLDRGQPIVRLQGRIGSDVGGERCGELVELGHGGSVAQGAGGEEGEVVEAGGGGGGLELLVGRQHGRIRLLVHPLHQPEEDTPTPLGALFHLA